MLYTATYGFGWDSPLQSNIFKFLGIGIGTLFRFWYVPHPGLPDAAGPRAG